MGTGQSDQGVRQTPLVQGLSFVAEQVRRGLRFLIRRIRGGAIRMCRKLKRSRTE
jgi:hypothetical protein